MEKNVCLSLRMYCMYMCQYFLFDICVNIFICKCLYVSLRGLLYRWYLSAVHNNLRYTYIFSLTYKEFFTFLFKIISIFNFLIYFHISPFVLYLFLLISKYIFNIIFSINIYKIICNYYLWAYDTVTKIGFFFCRFLALHKQFVNVIRVSSVVQLLK